MQYAPPPLFKQGAPARVRVVVYLLVALVLLMVDSRLHALVQVRQTIGFILYPIQKIAMLPRDLAYGVGDYFTSTTTLQTEVEYLRKQALDNSVLLQQAEQLSMENAHLRQLLKLSERIAPKSIPAEILYDARTTYASKIVLDRGANDGVTPGQPVIDENGVIGQVTRVFLSTSEVTLLTDKDQTMPVQVLRSGVRSIAYGGGHSGHLELRFMQANADIQEGDRLVTSGIDGVYPAGLAVAEVFYVSDRGGSAFGHVLCRPLAGVDRNRQVLVLLTDMNVPPRPPEEDDDTSSRKRRGSGVAEARRKAGVR